MGLSHACHALILTLAEVSFCRVEIWKSRGNSGPSWDQFRRWKIAGIWLPGLVNSHIAIEHGPVEIVDLPIKNDDFP
jgi:hypothetical protein